jgi:hypothetical protein
LLKRISPPFTHRRIFVAFLVILIIQAIDATLGNLGDIFKEFATSYLGLALFLGLACAYTFFQYVILGMVRGRIRAHKIKRFHFNMIEKVLTVSQYALSLIMVLIVIQVIIFVRYHTAFLNLAVIISTGIAAYVLGLLGYWLLSWYKRKKASILLLFGLGVIFSAFGTVSTSLLFNLILIEKEPVITPQSDVVYPASGWANTLQTYSGVASFILIWGGTVSLLRHNIYRIGRIKFWILSSTPIAIFSTIYLTLYEQIAATFPTDDPIGAIVIPVLLIIYSGIAAAILIGVAFRTVAKSLEPNSQLSVYLNIASYGFILFFTTTLTSLVAGFPPFGIINVLLVGPLSFMIMAGLYGSAISVSEDAKLRRSIKDETRKELKMVDSIGTAEMYVQMERKVLGVAKNIKSKMTEETGIQPSLSEEDMRLYVKDVVEEMK